jgi:hypothetical protein
VTLIGAPQCAASGMRRTDGNQRPARHDLVGKVLRCSYCGHRQTLGPPASVALPGFRRESRIWIVEMKNGERREFDTREAAWAWLDRRAPSHMVH